MADGEASWGGRLGWRTWLAVGLAVVVIVVVLLARLAGDAGSSSGGEGDRKSPAVKAGDDSVVEPSTTVAPPAAVATARRFVAAWLRPAAHVTAEKWWQGVAPYADPVLSNQLKLTDPVRVPARETSGEPSAESISASRVVFTFATDAGPVSVTCVQLGKGNVPSAWKVSDIDTGAGSATRN